MEEKLLELLESHRTAVARKERLRNVLEVISMSDIDPSSFSAIVAKMDQADVASGISQQAIIDFFLIHQKGGA